MFDTLLINPTINALVAIYHLLANLGVPYALGFSIILLTLLIRLLLYPLTSSQLRASKKMQDLAPHLSRIKEKHKGNAKQLQQETMLLYKEHGINPAAGCIPLLIQLPLLWGIYGVFQRIVDLKPQDTLSAINNIVYMKELRLDRVWDTSFFGVPLGQSPSKLVATVGILIFLVPLLTGVLQFIQSKMMFGAQQVGVAQKGEKKKEKQSDFASMFQTQSMYLFPIMIGFFSYSLPIGLSLYWNTFTIFGIIQQYQLHGFGGLSDLFPKNRQANQKKA